MEIISFSKTVGINLEHPTNIMTHYLFDGHVLRQVKYWHNIGALSEESIENAHAIWN